MSEDPTPSRPEPPAVYAKLADGIVLQMVIRYVGEVDGVHRWVTELEDLSAVPVRVWMDPEDPRHSVRVLAPAGTAPVVGPPHRSKWQSVLSWLRSWAPR